MLAPEALCAELEQLAPAAPRAFNVNFFAHAMPPPDPASEDAWRRALSLYYAELGARLVDIPRGPGRRPFNAEVLAVLAAAPPKVVSFHFGLPEPALLAQVRGLSIKILATATNVEEARWLEQRGSRMGSRRADSSAPSSWTISRAS
jgi:nitronate monooxygenase